jgi:NAD(P)-dependent dehydrogenase (short-subunit alcohol dehydrogenase family)
MAVSFSTALVVGASSGIGEQLVRQLVASGCTVAAVARREAELARIRGDLGERLYTYAHDVRDFDAAPALFDRIAEDLGGLDLVIYNAGVMPAVEEHEVDFEKDRQMIEVNLLGAMRWLGLAGAHMEARGSGTLCGISSVAGDRGRRANPGYHTSKAALTTYLESLRNRLARYGVSVVTIKPGPVSTDMTAGMKLPLMIPAEVCARQALSHMRSGTVEAYVPLAWWPIMSVIRAVPSFVFRRTNI